MNIRRLKIFMTVTETKSMTEAGKVLYMTQPAISQAIADLEEELKVKLFERINHKLVLNYTGEVLYQYGKQILNLIEEAEHSIDDIANMNKGRLRIGASTTIGIYLLPKIIRKFKEKNQEFDIAFVIDNTAVIEEMVLNYQLDIGLVEGPLHLNEIVVTPFCEDELYLVSSPQHPWAKMGRIDVNQLEGVSFMLREQGSGTREVFENTMTKHQISYKIQHIINNTEAIKKAVEENIGLAIISRLALLEELRTDRLARIELEGIRFFRTLNFIWHKDKYRSNLFEEFKAEVIKIVEFT